MFVYGLRVSSPILSLYLILIYMYFGLQIDRGNLIQAVSDSLLDDLNLPTNGISPTYLLHGYSADTIGKRLQHRKHHLPRLFSLRRVAPQLVSKKLGPDHWIPTQISLWSIVAMCQAGLSGKRSFWVIRALLGVLEVFQFHIQMLIFSV